jgi:GMP synthase-like glutamine amidotransferase
MKVHWLQHLPFEGLGSMGTYFRQKGLPSTSTHFYLNQPLPSLNDFDWLIIMGGFMGANDDGEYSWLTAEKAFIKKAIDCGKVVIGVCLGAQLIAAALGAKVYKNKYKEIGWFDIMPSNDAKKTILSDCFAETQDAFHWHGDTFDLPKGAIHLASSQACKNQGFVLDNRVVGFQFHLETTQATAKDLIEHCRNELDGSKYVQSESEMLSDISRFDRINNVMCSILDKLQQANS